MYLRLTMIKYFVTRILRVHVHLSKCWRDTCLSFEMLKEYMVRERLGTPVLVCSAGAEAQYFLSCFETKKLSTFSNAQSKYSINSLYYHNQSTLKPWFTNISVFRWNSCGLCKSLCSQQGQNLRKLWRVPQYFVSVGYRRQRKSKWTARFLTPSKFYSKNGHCFQ